MPQASVALGLETAVHLAPAAPPFLCICRAGSCAAWVHVAGGLDLATSPELDKALRAAQRSARLVVLDMRELTFIDSSAVHVIVGAAARAAGAGGRLMLVRGPPEIDLVFTLTGASDEVSIFDLDAAEPVPALHLPPRVCSCMGAGGQAGRQGSPWTCSGTS